MFYCLLSSSTSTIICQPAFNYTWAMRLIVLIVVLVLHGLFAVLNSTALMYPQDINLGFAQYTGPLGLLLLGTSALLCLLGYLWLTLSTLRREAGTARLLRDIDSLRQSLDTQEASRFAQLQAVLENRFKALDSQLAQREAAPAPIPAVSLQKSSQDIILRQELAELSKYLHRKLGE